MAAVTAHCRALSQHSPTRRSGKTPILTAPRHPPYCSPPLPRGLRGGWTRPGGAGLQVNGRRRGGARAGGRSCSGNEGAWLQGRAELTFGGRGLMEGESLAGAEGRNPCIEMRLPGRGARGGASTGAWTSGKEERIRAVWGCNLNLG